MATNHRSNPFQFAETETHDINDGDVLELCVDCAGIHDEKL